MEQIDGQAMAELIVGNSVAIREIRGLVRFAAQTNASVLITGPSGTGKELVAHALHRASQRAAAPFVAVNSGAIPRELIESELFGHEKGSFTGAIARRLGHFETANNGTLFLDEIGEMPLDMQVRLLRVLEDQKVRRIGSNDDVRVDVRLIAATHQCLESAIGEGRFRADLFYRLNVLPIELPALAERIEDIPMLVQHFLSRGFAADNPPVFTDEAMAILMAHDWPGNVRELKNLVERAAVFFQGMEVGTDQMAMLLRPIRSARPELSQPIGVAMPANVVPMAAVPSVTIPAPTPSFAKPIDLREYLQNEERRVLIEALESTGGVVSAAARLVKLQRTTFVEKMKRYQIGREIALSA
ncbi:MULTISPECIES: sigma-54 interaction domain-containing protein [Pseudomonadota]|jgi:sigma-54 specific flagellar transcriptional regulator A|uniref:sigma-54 interaction domain-containing protein n=3 Tax=Pseudomonadota TaxID=1224 RepID=UPI00076ABB63|nr:MULTISPECIES: sigma-54 dependent transcriptional regulator [Pseudomonadota]MAF62404.1 sigma-54-dependent Fis family transcriptional regulator [Blastomonas sp.]MBA4779664.1 sigma-54-dependent Fis family transcriptional regulator [Blastomonas sp.]|tara:strand:+ start:96647 stop:97717 length:1071 start_codon:yes stop_codon:yes gene_type:complete